MCNLYYKYGRSEYRLGTFRNRQKAEEFWNAIQPMLEAKLGTDLKPIYVETGKGRGRK